MNRARPSNDIILAFIGLVVLSAIVFSWIYVNNESKEFLRKETRFQEEISGGSINLEGVILTKEGAPLEGARVTLQGRTALSQADGSFLVRDVSRTNSLVQIEAPVFRTEFIPVHLFLPVNVSLVTVQPVPMEPSDPGMVRFLFGGDTHFGRRFIDPTETAARDQMPPDTEGALIRVSDPGPGTLQVLKYFRPIFQEADFSSLNLESPVVQDVSTPHRDKEYILFTLPGSLPALTWLGVRYVTLGNNHVYDYLDPGITSTLDSLALNGISASGAGLNATEAFGAYRVVLNGTPYSFLSMNSIVGSEHRIRYVATETKGGSANLEDTLLVTTSIQRESAAGNIPIVQVHGGTEYTYEPAAYIRDRMDLVTRAGAGLVVSHHPHIAQGVEVMNGVVVIEGLGNFAFDTRRLETELGLLARVDMDGTGVHAVRLIPVYLENSTPRPVSGRLADTFLRRIGEFSRNATHPVYPYNGQGIVTLGSNAPVRKERTIQVNITVPDSGVSVLDLRQWAQEGESLAEAKDETALTSTAQLGRDLMLFGDFEDWDLDEYPDAADHWDVSAGSAFVCMSGPYKGTSSLCSIRYGDNTDDSVIPFRNRIRVMGDALNQVPNKNLSFIGYMRGEQAGPITIVSRYSASEGEITFGEEEILTHPGGTFPWQAFVADLHMPADDPSRLRDPETDPRALQIFLRQSPPDFGLGIAMFDEIAVISWEETVNLSEGAVLTTPHARDFLRITASPGPHLVTLKFHSFSPVGTET